MTVKKLERGSVSAGTPIIVVALLGLVPFFLREGSVPMGTDTVSGAAFSAARSAARARTPVEAADVARHRATRALHGTVCRPGTVVVDPDVSAFPPSVSRTAGSPTPGTVVVTVKCQTAHGKTVEQVGFAPVSPYRSPG